jgi:hypothetical protein
LTIHPLALHQYKLPLQSSAVAARSFSKKKGSVAKEDVKDKSIKSILQESSDNIQQMRPNELTEMWSTLARLLAKDDGHKMSKSQHPSRQREANKRKLHVACILKHTMQRLHLFTQKEFVEIVYSLGRIVQKVGGKESKRTSVNLQAFTFVLFDEKSKLDKKLLQPIAVSLKKDLHLFNLRGYSRIMDAYAMMGYVPVFKSGDTLFENLLDQTMEYANELDQKSITIILRSSVKLKLSNHVLFQSVGDLIVDKMDMNTFTPSYLSDLVRSYATINEHHPALFKKVADSILGRNLSLFKPPELSEIVCSYATLNEQNPEMFRKISKRIIASRGSKLRAFQPDHIALILWSFEKSGELHPKLLTMLVDRINSLGVPSNLTSDELSDKVSACATEYTQNSLDPYLFHSHLFKRIEDFKDI